MHRQLLRILAQRNQNNRSALEKGFTLVELIVVVVIIGILSAIAVPAFNASADKAKQKEATTLLASYVKAAQAYYTENSSWPTTRAQLSQFVTVTGCTTTNTAVCKTRTPANYQNYNAAGSWYSPQGLYQIVWQPGTVSYFRAIPAGNFRNSGYGVSACFNSSTGNTKVVDRTTKGPNVPNVGC